MNKPVCYILIGLPGSGKSTYRDSLNVTRIEQGLDPIRVISSDDLIEEIARGEGITYSAAMAKCDFKAINRAVNEAIDNAFRNNHDVIIDRTNLSVKSRNKVLCRVPRNYVKVGVLFDVPIDIVRERLVSRATATGKHIPDDVFTDMLNRYEAPISGEFHQIIRV